MKTVSNSNRRWLNRKGHHGDAFISWRVGVEEYTPRAGGEANRFFDPAEVIISDCSRQITLDFAHDDAESRANAFRKLAIIQAELRKFETALAEASVLVVSE